MAHVASNIPGQVRMLEVIRDGLRHAQTVDISVSFLRCSGFSLLRDDLASFADRGGKARLLTSTYMGITQPEALLSLLSMGGIESRIHIGTHSLAQCDGPIVGFHPKFYIFGEVEAECWVGSSNLTKGGLTGNIEANIHHMEPEAVKALREMFELLWTRKDVVPVCRKLADNYAAYLRRIAPPPINRSWTMPPPSDSPTPVSDLELDQAKDVVGNFSDEEAIDKDSSPVRANEAQTEALQRLHALRKMGERRACVIAAPGVGKTFLAVLDAFLSGAKNLLFLSHRKEHLTQAIRTFSRLFNESRTLGRLFEGHAEDEEDFVFSTVSSASGSPKLLNRHFDYVVVDEFHHAEAPSYKRLLERLSYQFLLGLTATPERQDGHDVLVLCDYNVAYEVRLVEAINRGWLLPFHYFGISDETVDYASIPWRSGRFKPDELETALMLNKRVDEILKHALQLGFDGPRRATIGFCAGVRHAKFMAESFKKRGLEAIAITGEDTVEFREAVYDRLQNVQDCLEWVFVADVLNEGVDIPCINSILFLRPTESATIFIQQLGRGLRLSDGSQVLTVLDFVGHHKSAWLSLSVLNDPDASTSAASIPELQYTPPRDCEVVLDSRTFEILKKVKRHSESKKDLCLAAYKKLCEEEDRPYPLHLWGRTDVPEFSTYKSAFGSWLNLRKAAEHAEEWEMALQPDDPTFRFLLSLEKDWQAQRVYPYALVWALSVKSELSPEQAYERFFERFPIWKCEYKPLAETKVWQSLQKNLGDLLESKGIALGILNRIPRERLADEVEGRIRLVLAKNYRTRHGGVLRTPADLVLHRRYSRPEVVNHFGQQYDPAKHNFGVLKLENAIVIMTKIDTSGAKLEHQYSNRFIDNQTFQWQSQNQQRQNNPAGRLILDHKKKMRQVYLFVQSRSHEKAIFCGQLEVKSATGNAPMNVLFTLQHQLLPELFAELSVPKAEDVALTDLFVPPTDSVVQEYSTHLPLYSLAAAAGYFGKGESVEPLDWVDARAVGKLNDRMFLVRASGRSMEPAIHDNDLLVFRHNPTGSRQGRIVLAEYRGPSDPETGGSYTVKKYYSEKKTLDGYSWTHSRISLQPLNPNYNPIEIDAKNAEDFRIVGEFLQVLPQ